MLCHVFTHEISERKHSYLPESLRSTSGTIHMCLQQQLTEQMQKTFASPSINVVKKKKKDKKSVTT